LSPNAYTNWLEEIIDSINDGVLVIDSQGIVQLINAEYTKITGVQKEKIIGEYLVDVRKGAILPRTLEDGERRSGIYRKEGENEYIVDMAPVYEQDRLIGAVSVLKSLTEVHHLAKELKQSREKLTKLENTVGHIYRTRYTFDDIIGKDGGLKETVELAKKAAHSNLNILIQGESGTGKELFAHAIHRESFRSEFPFVPINCAAIPSSLLESELFGYEEGSFTNSKKGGKIGLFELANYGTLFLDEIGDLPSELQAKLLRVLQDGRIRKVGSLNEQEIDVQIITATNKNLGNMVEKQRFREDLYYRLNGIQVAIPPLRSRKKDLPVLINHLLNHTNTSQSLCLTEEVRDAISQYDWPGNTRELFNVVHYAINMTDSNNIEFQHLPESIRKHGLLTTTYPQESLKEVLKKTEQEVIQQTVKSYSNTLDGKKKAAKKLGISLATLYNKMNQSVNSKR
jgi:PAS domain S-box-containing protein